MRYSREKFKEDLLVAKKMAYLELQKRKKGQNGESTIEQLQDVILPELEYLLKMIESEKMPESNDRYLNSFANAFTVWGWSMERPTELFVKLTELNNNFKKL